MLYRRCPQGPADPGGRAHPEPPALLEDQPDPANHQHPPCPQVPPDPGDRAHPALPADQEPNLYRQSPPAALESQPRLVAMACPDRLTVPRKPDWPQKPRRGPVREPELLVFSFV